MDNHKFLTWFVDNPVAANLMMAIFITGGFISLISMHKVEFPNIEPGIVQIQIPYLGAAPEEVETRCRFLVYRNRQEDEHDTYIGKRNDTLRRVDGVWKIARREIFLDQNVLLSKNISVFL